MRAPLLRLALLLAAAQYAEASGCPGASAPKLTFQIVDPDVADAEVDCKDFDLDNTAACDPTHKIFMQQGPKWTEVNEVKCDAATVKWMATPDGGAPVELTSNEIVVCAKLAPDTKKCGACANILKKACTGATCGGDLTEGISAARCREFGCGSAEVLEVDGDKKLGAAEKITCTDQKKWTSSVGDVTEAVCVKNAPPPGPSCSAILAPCNDAAIVDPAAGCIAPTSPGDVLTCADATSSKLFVDTGAGWKEDAGKCVSGKWTLSGATPTEIKKAVCAKQDPTPPGTSAACQPVTDSCADTDVKTGATFKCKKPDPDSANTVLNCAAPTPDLYAFIGTNWEKGAATCDAGAWKMDVNTVATAFTKAVCANEDPTAAPPPGDVCTQCAAITDKDCNANDGCVAGGTLTQGVTADAKQCKTLKCTDGVFITEPAQQGQVDEILCADVGGVAEWTFTDEKIDKASCVKKVSCGKIGHLKSDCTGETEFEKCVEIVLDDDVKPACTAPSDKMFFKPNGGVWAEETGDITCELFTGIWMRGDNQVGAGSKVICAESQKAACGTACPAFTDALFDCKPEEGCIAGAPATEAIVGGCPEKTCTSPNFFVDNTGKLIDTPKILCSDQNEWQQVPATGTAVTNAFCVEKFECHKKNPLSSDDNTCAGLENPTDCVKVELAVNTLACTDPSTQSLYMKPAAGPWEKEPNIVCEEKSGVWMRGTAPNKQAMAKNDAVVCHTALPIGKTCPALLPMAVTECEVDPTIEPTAAATCQPLTFSHDDPIVCAKELYFQTDRSVMWKKSTGDFQCDKQANVWKDASPKLDGVVKKAICVDKDPNRQHPCPPLPTNDCSSIDASLDCSALGFPIVAAVDQEYTATNLQCPTDKKLYFKPKGHHFQEWSKIKCNQGKWRLSINYEINPYDTLASNEDSFICAKSNPDPAVCTRENKISKYVNYKFDKPKQTYEVGQRLECGDRPEDKFYEFLSSGDKLPAENTKHIVCNQDGTWKMGSVDYGKVACGIMECRECDALPTEASVSPLPGYIKLKLPTTVSQCLEMECAGRGDSSKFTVLLDSEDEYLNHKGQVMCVKKTSDGKSTWTIANDGKRATDADIKEAICAQKLYCLTSGVANAPRLKQVKLDCPTEVPGCIPPTAKGAAAGIPDNTLECPTGKILLIGPLDANNDVQHWEEVTGWKIEKDPNHPDDPSKDTEVHTPDLHCDDQHGKWNVRIVEENNKKDQRDYKHRIVCADSNPKKKTTTTTTTTEAPKPIPICDLCRLHLPNIPEDFNSTAYLVSDNPDGIGEICVMKAKDGFQLLVGEMNEVVKALMCTREDSTSWYARTCAQVEHSDGNKNETCKQSGAKIEQFKSKLEEKSKDWKPMVYVVIAVTLILIGGMGIGCVMIFLRMRKDLSEKEKKKERGVTKKYTTANVMKTSGKSSGGRSELGKSKEPTKSKMEENEDAPTLKL